MRETAGYANEELGYAMLESYNGATTPIGCAILTLNAYPVENLTIAEANVYFVVLAVVLPLAVATVGIILCRKRKLR